MAEHVQTRALEHLRGTPDTPRMAVAIETRERPGPAYKAGVWSDDIVWVQLVGGLFVAKARVKTSWRGEYSRLDDVKPRAGAAGFPDDFWSGRPRRGYAVVCTLDVERWIDPFWAGPRTYGYEWIVLEDDKKRGSWLDPKEPPRGGEGLLHRFEDARARSFA
jgi:hypothetical protein